jgi:hypothetical protein
MVVTSRCCLQYVVTSMVVISLAAIGMVVTSSGCLHYVVTG